MNKFLGIFLIIISFSIGILAQTKSLSDAQNEVKSFTNSQNFSVIYDESKYVTNAEVKFDILEEKTPLAKQFKEFGFTITSLFAIDGIDTKPVRTTLCINTRSKKFYFSSNRSLTLSLDNEVINLGEGNRSTELKGRKIKENLCWEIDKEIIKDLGMATNIGYEVGKIKGNIDPAKLSFFKDYSKLILIPEIINN